MTAASLNLGLQERHALLLVGHGTRDTRGQREFAETASGVAKRLPGIPVAHGFLELATPTIGEALGKLARNGIKGLTIAPMLLVDAGHAKRDIPRAVALAAEPFRELTYRVSRPYGCHESILELSARRFDEALAELPKRKAADTALVIVGRGSRDPETPGEMRYFGELRQERVGVGAVRIGFLAMAEPSLGDALSEAGASGARRVVVQPHLLFHGELVARISSEVDRCRSLYPKIEWVVTQHLGPHELLVDATIERANQAGLPNLGPHEIVVPK